MFFVKAAMRGTALLAVIAIVTFNSSCVGASLNNKQEHSDEIRPVHLFHNENNTLHLTWGLSNPSGTVQGYRVTWDDGTAERWTHESRAETLIAYPSDIECHDELNVTITPLDEDNKPIGKKSTKKFSYADVVTDVTLTPEENMISASWTLRCPSGDVNEVLVLWEEGTNAHEQQSCLFPATATNTKERTKCDAELELQSCKTYNVSIEPLDSSLQFIGIAGNVISYTLEEGSGSKLVESIELKEADSQSATLLWKGPNPECPGTNYAFSYTETRLGDGQAHKGHAKVVKGSKWSNQNKDQLITANVHPSDSGEVMCYVDNLQPFSEYEFCVAAESVATNLACLTVQTLEEKPDKPTHLSLQNEQRSSATIDVTWKEPPNMIGKLVNYIVRWSQGYKHGSHNTTKLSYAIVDAEPCVNYTIAVAAVNGAGEGEATETIGALEGADCSKSDCNTDSTETWGVDGEGKIGTKKETMVDAVTREDSPTQTYLLIGTIGAFAGFVLCLLLIVLAQIFWPKNNRMRRNDPIEKPEKELLQGSLTSSKSALISCSSG